MSELAKKQHYGAIDGLRAFSAIGIVLMHVLGNGKYAVPGFVFGKLIPSFTNLVFLFMIISGFSLCCGYYEKAINGTICWGDFYKKRFAKVWPFFAFWSVADLLLSPSVNSLYEVFANLTLCFGLLPNPQISVIGVGWFLGLVFAFYMLFPFFCWLISSKKRAWASLAIALVLNYLCTVHFAAERTNIVYSAAFFLAGGLIYLYKEQLGNFVHKWKWLVLLAVVLAAVCYYAVGAFVPVMLVLYSLVLIYVLDGQGKYRILNNRVTKFLGGISMEIYLCHMVAFRVIETLGLTQLFASDVLSFAAAAVCTLGGAVGLSMLTNWLLKQAGIWKVKLTNKKVSG